MKKGLGIFAKQPIPGRVKTRLTPPLSQQQACDFYRTSLQETVTAMSGDFDAVLFYDGDRDWFTAHFPGIALVPQEGDDLGERMAAALQRLQRGCDACALIGSDSPDLPTTLVEKAFAALDDAPGGGVAVIPSSDGGYVLIGERGHHPQLFRDIPWSTSQVLPMTRDRAGELAIDFREIGEWQDVDDLASLKSFLERSPQSHTARFARVHFAALL